MAAATADLTIIHTEELSERNLYVVSIVVVDDYATGGIAVNEDGNETFDDIKVTGGGYLCEWAKATQKLILKYPRAAHAHDLLIKGGQAAAGTAALAWYATDILGKEAATDKTILGADSATKGGVLSGVAAVAAEVGNGVTLASTTLSGIAIGQ